MLTQPRTTSDWGRPLRLRPLYSEDRLALWRNFSPDLVVPFRRKFLQSCSLVSRKFLLLEVRCWLNHGPRATEVRWRGRSPFIGGRKRWFDEISSVSPDFVDPFRRKCFVVVYFSLTEVSGTFLLLDPLLRMLIGPRTTSDWGRPRRSPPLYNGGLTKFLLRVLISQKFFRVSIFLLEMLSPRGSTENWGDLGGWSPLYTRGRPQVHEIFCDVFDFCGFRFTFTRFSSLCITESNRRSRIFENILEPH